MLKISPRGPKANAFAERWVRTLRTECLDWLLWSRRHLEQVLAAYMEHYNSGRPHRRPPPRRRTRPVLVDKSTQDVSATQPGGDGGDQLTQPAANPTPASNRDGAGAAPARTRRAQGTPTPSDQRLMK